MGYGLGSNRVVEKALARTVVLASADAELRQRLGRVLTTMRWDVREAGGGAEAMAQLDATAAEALLVDSWLPDLEVEEFAGQMRSLHPEMDMLRFDGGVDEAGVRSPRRNELLQALREVERHGERDGADDSSAAAREVVSLREVPGARATPMALPDVIGEGVQMRRLARLVRLVAPHSATVLIQGETGTGKELVAKAVHRLSARSAKAFVVLNCAAIPESLLEAELFGHTRGAFTGAVQSRTGRVEAADGGTLFLDEIGEMPLALQAKMLRFLESGEIQRVGGNETVRVDVRVVAATHQPLKQRTAERAFRLDLYHRLAVFLVTVPALRDRMEDLEPLASYLLGRLGEEMPVKRLSAGALARLKEYDWPGNVRELAHVLERATILVEDRLEITAEEIQF